MSEFELIEREANSILDDARGLIVKCDEEYSQAGDFIMGCKALVAKIQGQFKEPKQKAFDAHRAITQMEKDTLAPVQQAMTVASDAALTYKREQDRLAQDERDRIAAEARRKQEEERLARAEQLEAEGKAEEADEILSAPIVEPRGFKPPPSVPKVAGLSTRKTWKVRILRGKGVTRDFCLPSQSLLDNHVKSFFAYNSKATPEQIQAMVDEMGGDKAVEIYEDETFAGRRA